MLDIEATERELAELADGIRKEVEKFRTGTGFLKSAESTVQANIEATAQLLEDFKKVSADFRGLEERITSIDFSGYFAALAERNKVLQEGINRIMEKQAGLFLLIEEAQKKRESAENQLVESLRSMEGKLMQKVKLCLALGGAALVALGVLLAKVFG